MVIIACSAGAAQLAGAQTGFSGSYTVVTTDESGKQTTAVVTQKPGKMRWDLKDASTPMAMIYDANAKTSTVLMHSQKLYMTQPQGQHAPSTESSSSAEKGTLTKTGQSKVVAGVPCEVYHYSGFNRDRKEEGDACVAKGVGFNPLDMESALGGRGVTMPNAPGLREMLTGGYGILEVSTVHDGKPVTDFQVTSIDRSSPSDAAFMPPPDYHAMPAGMGRMAMPPTGAQRPQ